jgi:hypothetical protein
MRRKFPTDRVPSFRLLRLVVISAMWWRRIARSAEDALDDITNVLGDSRVQKETKASLTDLVSASRRTREIGLPDAFADKLVARRLSRAADHASSALDAARGHRRRKHVWRRTVVATVGVGIVAGSAYVGWRSKSTRDSPS